MLIDAIVAVFRDIGFAIRSLRRTPGFTIIAIITLGLGIGANTSAFSVLNAVLLRPLPYADTEHLERIYRATAQDSRGGFSPADYLDLNAEMSRYGEIAAYGWSDMAVSVPGQPPEMASGLRVTANLLPLLGIAPELGRGFTPDEAILGNHRVLLLTQRYWKNHFGADPAVIGRTVRVDGEAHVIVGVLPESINDWRHLGAADLYRPLGLTDKEMIDRGGTWVRLVGRRSRSLTAAQAAAVIVNFGRRLAADYPQFNAGANWRTVPINFTLVDDNGPPILAMLIGLSGFVLLIACSNLANLLLARTMARAHELAVRAALGASRVRLLRPLVVESMLLAFAGGLCALDVAMWTHDWLRVQSTGDNGEQVVINLD
jgi:putative ABC transport system permease protein